MGVSASSCRGGASARAAVAPAPAPAPGAPADAAAAPPQDEPAILAPIAFTAPPETLFELGRALGRGNFATVVIARDRGTGAEVAIKTLSLGKVRAAAVAREHAVLVHIAAVAAAAAAETAASAAAETAAAVVSGSEAAPASASNLAVVVPPAPAVAAAAATLAGLVAFRGALRTPAPRAEVSFVFELMRGGELFAFLIKRGALPEPLVRRSLRPVAEALAFLHAAGVVHRDVKPENLLLAEAVPDAAPLHELRDLRLRLSDFGLAQLLDARGGKRLAKACGTWAYAAPEMAAEHQPGYAFKYDLWSLGIVLFIMLSGVHPFDQQGALDAVAIKARIQRGDMDFAAPVWARVSPLGIDLVRRLLRVEQEARLSAPACLAHGWWLQGPASSSSSAASSAPSSRRASQAPSAAPPAPASPSGSKARPAVKLKVAATVAVASTRFASALSSRF